MAENYKVTEIRESTALDERGNLVPVYVVYFVTKSGFPLSVEIPKAQFSQEEADKQISAIADVVEEVKAL